MENMVKKLAFRVIEILKSPIYKIPVCRIQHMEFLVEHMVIIQANSTTENQTITLFDYQKRPVGSISIHSVSQIIDVPPIFNNGEQINIIPTLVLTENADSKTILHEICHLLSISSYIQSKDYFLYHCFGICEFSYISRDQKTESQILSGHEGVNEILTDYMAWYFMNLLYNEALPFYTGTIRFGKYLATLWRDDVTTETLVGWYFSGNITDISRFLLNSRYKNYNFLYVAIYDFRTGAIDEKKAALIEELYGSVPDSGLTLEETKAERRNKQ